MPPDASRQMCQYLDWDSDFFGVRIARLSGGRLTPEKLKEAAAWCELQRIDCLYFLADANDPETVCAAERGGFELVDIRVTLDRELYSSDQYKVGNFRFARMSDLDRLRQIARASHGDSRFYYDARFARSRCDDLYETWIRRSCEGWADAVLISQEQDNDEPSGYVTCHLAPSKTGSIGLVAVAVEARGKGFGQQLTFAALQYFRGSGMERVTVVTQGRNVVSQRTYQRCGFRTSSVALWYHRWFT